jgi:hypothetical protein
MDPLRRPTIRRIVQDAQRHAPLVVLGGLVVVVLVAAAVGLAAFQPSPGIDDTGIAAALASSSALPSPTNSPTSGASLAIESEAPSIAPSATPEDGMGDTTSPTPGDATAPAGTESTSTPTPHATAQPTARSTPEPTPVPQPAARLQVGDERDEGAFLIATGDSVSDILHLKTRDLDVSKCTVSQAYEPDDPDRSPWTRDLKPIADQKVSIHDGKNTFTARCPSSAGTLKASVRAIGFDRQPEACKDFAFERSAISISTFDELTAGVVGTWKGCVTTPWLPMYQVTVTLRADGTYSAHTSEVLDFNRMIAMYYGTDDDLPTKVYAVLDLQDSRLGVGQIDIAFDLDPAVRDGLRNIRLMGDKLEFEMFHFEQYGPITFRLYRQ